MPRQAKARARLLSFVPLVLAAQDDCAVARTVADVDPFHWGYALMFGTGVYRLSDGTEARIVRISPSVELREPVERPRRDFGVRLRLPFTLGVQNLDDESRAPDRPNDELEHAAFLPGVELEFPGERWTLRATAWAGWGTELEGEEKSAALAAVGVRSRVRWPGAAGRPAWIGGVLWGGFETGDGERGSLLRFTQALEFDVPVPRWEFRGSTMNLMPHVLADWYYSPPAALAFGDPHFEQVESEWQMGLAARRDGGFRILWLEFEAVGIAYRFSEHSAGLRFFLNSVF